MGLTADLRGGSTEVAFNVSVAGVSAEAVKAARENINNNTEMNIMVSWSGGSVMKPSMYSLRTRGVNQHHGC